MLPPGLLARFRRADVQPSGTREARHHAVNRVDHRGVAGESGQFDVEVAAGPQAGILIGDIVRALHQVTDGVDVSIARSLDRQPHHGRLDRLTKFTQVFDLDEVDRGHRPAARVATHEALGLQPHERRPCRCAGRPERALQPALGQPLAGREVEREDRGPQTLVQM